MKSAERVEGRDGPRIELQLDTAQILLVIAALATLCASAFLLGRWIERDRWREETARQRPRSTAVTDSDTGADLTFFDTLGAQSAEPHREVATPRQGTVSSVQTAQPPANEPDTAEDSDSPSQAAPRTSPAEQAFAVQVFAGDRTQAEKLVTALSRKGYAVRVIPGTSGPRTARVRVYGYRSRAEADQGAERLRLEEKLSAWVMKAN